MSGPVLDVLINRLNDLVVIFFDDDQEDDKEFLVKVCLTSKKHSVYNTNEKYHLDGGT